jgi:transaldolase
MNPLLQLLQCGQSYWLDNLTRGKIVGGELQQRVRAQGLRGVTSNPAIVHKAIAGSRDYDAQIEQLVRDGCAIHDIYEQLIVADVQQACAILRPVYEATDGADGFVSLEVSPHLAYDTAATVQEVRRLWQAVDRPNLMVKIPGTPAGLPAIEQMLYEGHNINITLLFAVADYEAVTHAYIRALQRRVHDGQPVHHVASVASFFLSRIDVLVDQLLSQRIRPGAASDRTPRAEHLFGQVAIANAKLAYQSFKRIFSGEAWRALAAHGARVQRPLWASTSAKDPLYDDVRYVEPLIGPSTVNTLPEETIAAFADHGVVEANTVKADLERAQQTMRHLAAIGIRLDYVTWQLQHEGVQKFSEPFDRLMQTLAEKRQALLGASLSCQRLAPGRLQATLTPAFSAVDSRRWTRRLFAHDAFLWTADPRQAEAIRQRLGWLDSIELLRQRASDLMHFAAEVRDARFAHVVLLARRSMASAARCAATSSARHRRGPPGSTSIPGIPPRCRGSRLPSTPPAPCSSWPANRAPRRRRSACTAVCTTTSGGGRRGAPGTISWPSPMPARPWRKRRGARVFGAFSKTPALWPGPTWPCRISAWCRSRCSASMWRPSWSAPDGCW